MKRLLLTLTAGLTALLLAGPARADRPDWHKEYRKQLKEEQKRLEEALRERNKREAEFYREQAKRQRELRREWDRHPARQPAFGPVPFVLPPAVPFAAPLAHRPGISERDLERHVERTVKHRLGGAIKDIDVDVNNRRGRIEVDAEVRHPAVRTHLEQMLYSMPELAGYRLELDIEVDD